MKTKGHLLSQAEEYDIYQALVNFCIRKINKGEPESLLKCFQLYQEMEEKDLLIQGKYLRPWTYKNIITAALRLNEVNWTKNFIHKYKNKLSEEHRDNAFYYNSAKFNFHLKKYDKVLSFLQKVEYEDVFYGLDARTLMMKIYYLKDETDALTSLTESFRIYLRRKKRMPKERRKTYLNFIKFVKKLSLSHPRDYQTLRQLRNKIEETPKVADKTWLLDAVAEKIKKVETVYKS